MTPPPHHHHHQHQHLSWQLIGNKVSIFPLLRFVGYERFRPVPPENQKIPPPLNSFEPHPLYPGDK